jgi:hypothetical protein
MDNKAFGAMEEYVQILKPARIIGFVVGIISMGTSGTTSFMRHSLRRESLNRRLEQQQSNKPDEVI